MPLPLGTRLGPYEILDNAGSGGMGEVYKARDTRLDRMVAVKVLPEDFAADLERRQRFEREARLVASLSHPHICALHDIGTFSPADSGSPGPESRAYLVMEFVEGETLAERLSRGPLPLTDLARYGRDIALALHAAHRQHIVHRDLKPGNVMLTRSGVKLLDFGLAKANDPFFHASDAQSTRAVSGMTSTGTLMGTVPYMAPEQVDGRPADARSDIFALGAVLYEMATGRRAFDGSSTAAIASAILTSEPPQIVSAPALERIVRRCLEKDPERRWQSAQDIAIQLEQLSDTPEETARHARRFPAWLPWTIAAASLMIAGALVWIGRGAFGSDTSGVHAGPVAFPLPPPAGGAFAQWVEFTGVSVSPDSSAIVYSARDAKGGLRLWIRQLHSVDARPLNGTEGATSMFWSPDGKSIAFFAGSRLKRLDIASGAAPTTVCAVREVIGQMGTWGADGRILFASVQGEAIQAVPASGGTPTDIRKPDPNRAERRLTWPTFLPDGRRYLYQTAYSDDSGAVMMASDGQEPRKILDVKSNVEYVDPGYLLFANDGNLVARRFDPSAGTVSGEPLVVADRVWYFKPTGLALFSASRTGAVVYQPHGDEGRLALFDRAGREVTPLKSAANGLTLSADGRRVLFDRMDTATASFDIWMHDLERGVEKRVTNDPRTDAFPVWAPDGTMIYAVASGSAPRLFRRDLGTSRDQELSPSGMGHQAPTSISPDGQYLLYAQRTSRGNFDVMVRRLPENQTLPFRDSAADETDGQFSPDGRLVAYVSDESGRSEVLVAPFPSGPSTTVSADGGTLARWSRNGAELFYVASDGEVISVPIRFNGGPHIGRPARVFSTRRTEGSWRNYAVLPDGRFIAVVKTQIGAQRPMTVLTNWPASVSR